MIESKSSGNIDRRSAKFRARSETWQRRRLALFAFGLILTCLLAIPTLLAGCTSKAAPTSTTLAMGSTTTSASSALIRAPEGSVWGYLDASGAWVIKPQFAEAGNFHEGLALVKDGSLWGYIDETGKIVIKPQYVDARPFADGLARVATKRTDNPDSLSGATGYGWIDKTGKFVIPPTWDQADDFFEGLAVVAKGASFGYVDSKGTIAIPLKFHNAGSFSEGLAYASVGGKWGYIDKKGVWVIAPKYGLNWDGVLFETWRNASADLGVGRFHNGYGVVWDSGKRAVDDSGCRFIDKTGEMVFGRTFESAGDFREGLAMVMVNHLWGFIDTTGRMVVQPQFSGGNDLTVRYPGFAEGLAAVRDENGRTGYIDKTGRWVIKPTYVTGSSFVNGIAYVQTMATWNRIPNELIDKNGHVLYRDAHPSIVAQPDALSP